MCINSLSRSTSCLGIFYDSGRLLLRSIKSLERTSATFPTRFTDYIIVSMMSRGLFFYNECEEQSHEAHVLESCYLCAKPFTDDSEIYMYRGNTPFCSDDCRQEQIEFDEAMELKRQKKVVAMRQSDADQSSPSSDVRPGSIQVA